MEPNTNEPAFGLLVESCKTHGINRTVAFQLAASGLLDTFKIGARRYVKFASLRSLPERLAAETKVAP